MRGEVKGQRSQEEAEDKVLKRPPPLAHPLQHSAGTAAPALWVPLGPGVPVH